MSDDTPTYQEQTVRIQGERIIWVENTSESMTQMEAHWENFSKKEKAQILNDTAGNMARNLAADLVHSELAKSGKGLRQIERECGLQPAVISRVATGNSERGPDLSTLFKIAMSLGKNLHISFEDPIIDDD